MERINIWDRNKPLFLYGNEDKLNDLLFRIYGEIIKGYQETAKDGLKSNLKISTKIGGFLSALGLINFGAEVGLELNSENSRTKIVNSDINSKIKALTEYFNKQNSPLPYFDLYNDLRLEENKNLPVSEWKNSIIRDRDKISQIGYTLCLYNVKRILPPDNKKKANIAREFLNKENNLWLFYSIQGSKYCIDVPVLLSNARLVSQHAVVALDKFYESYYKIETLGLISWDNDKIICDPIYWRLFI